LSSLKQPRYNKSAHNKHTTRLNVITAIIRRVRSSETHRFLRRLYTHSYPEVYINPKATRCGLMSGRGRRRFN